MDAPTLDLRRTALKAIAAATAAAAAVAIGLNLVIATVARTAGTSHQFKPLDLSSYAALTVIGVGVGAIGWTLVAARASRPRETLRVLVPVVVVLSLVPDAVLGVSKTQAHTTWGAVAALVIMHLAVAATAVFAFNRALPVR